MSEYGPPEHVYVENDWYDGPRSGVADVDGRPHRFVSRFDEAEEDDDMGTFVLWPLEEAELLLEREQWNIFVSWNEQYEAGRCGVESHPGHGGVDRRWDELESILKELRARVPEGVRYAKARVVPVERTARYAPSGPSYRLAWKLL
ncbi:MAG: hypothetical protein IPK71_10490 [Myxococcales bacterium]|nr:hypothetical protein [Myxococcales bacterium]